MNHIDLLRAEAIDAQARRHAAFQLYRACCQEETDALDALSKATSAVIGEEVACPAIT